MDAVMGFGQLFANLNEFTGDQSQTTIFQTADYLTDDTALHSVRFYQN
jgi:hypothetical protein